MAKKIISLCILIMVALTLGANGNADAGADSADGGMKNVSVMNWTLWPVPGEEDVNDNRWANIYKEALPDVNINWVIVPQSQLSEKKNVLMAAGQAPDMMPITDLEMIRWSQDGLIVPLDDLVAEYYPHQGDYLDSQELQGAFYDGKQYRLFTPTYGMANPKTLHVREDWLKNVGGEIPTTLDDMYTLMEKFTFEDPNKSGKDDTFGFGFGKNLHMVEWIQSAYGVHDSNNMSFWSEVDGQLIPDITRPEMKEALLYINSMYRDGLMDKDSLVQTQQQIEEKVTAGIYGITEFYSGGIFRRMNPSLSKEGGKLIPISPIKGPNGQQMYGAPDNVYPNKYGVTVTCENPEVPVQLINWLMTPDTSNDYKGFNADRLGLGDIGVHSKLNEEGNFLVEAPQGEQGQYDRFRFTYRLTMSWFQIVEGEDRLGSTNYKESKIVEPFAVYNSKKTTGPIEAEMWDELKTYYDEIKMQIVTGDGSGDEFETWVEYFYANGGQDIVDEVNAAR